EDKQPIRHTAVSMANLVIQVIDQKRYAHFQRAAALLSYFHSFFLGGGLGEGNARFIIGCHTPAIDGMRFADINPQELDPVAVLCVEIFQDPKLGSVRASGKAAKDQFDLLLATNISERNSPFPILSLEREIGSWVADCRTFMPGSELAF